VLLYAALSLLNNFFCDKAIIDKTLFNESTKILARQKFQLSANI